MDVKRGIVLSSVGFAAYDLYGADRRRRSFSGMLAGLDARTGKRLWHFQV